MFPVGIITREIKVGPVTGLSDNVEYAVRVLVEPSRSLVWDSAPVLTDLDVYNVPAGESGMIELPVTDQSGYRDSKGNLIVLGAGQHAFYYKISIFYMLNGSIVSTKPVMRVVLPEGTEPVDIDEVLQFNSPVAGVISVPDSWSTQVALAQAAAQAAEASATEVASALENLDEFVGDSVDQWFLAHPESVVSPESLSSAIEAHEQDPTPHRAYDVDMPSLTVLFENGLV